jgi:sporulation protein YlmC with PRC-barrel domain
MDHTDQELDMRKALMLGAATLALAVAAPSFAQDRTAPGTPGTSPSQTNRSADQAAQERKARLSSAQPAQQLAVSGDALIGTEVRNTNDQKVGTVKDIVLQDGKISAIIVGRGGVLGMGTDYHQVEFAQVKMTSDMETVVLDLSEDQVKALPKMAYEKGKWGAAPARAEKDTTTPPARTSPGAPPSGTAPKTDTPPAQKDAPMKKDEPAPKKDQ